MDIVCNTLYLKKIEMLLIIIKIIHKKKLSGIFWYKKIQI